MKMSKMFCAAAGLALTIRMTDAAKPTRRPELRPKLPPMLRLTMRPTICHCDPMLKITLPRTSVFFKAVEA